MHPTEHDTSHKTRGGHKTNAPCGQGVPGVVCPGCRRSAGIILEPGLANIHMSRPGRLLTGPESLTAFAESASKLVRKGLDFGAALFNVNETIPAQAQNLLKICFVINNSVKKFRRGRTLFAGI